MTSVPSNLGDAAHRKLKADQWRVLGTTFLPLSLVRLWGLTNAESPRSHRCREILNLTMSLLSAVTVASSHSMFRVLSIENSVLYHLGPANKMGLHLFVRVLPVGVYISSFFSTSIYSSPMTLSTVFRLILSPSTFFIIQNFLLMVYRFYGTPYSSNTAEALFSILILILF